MCCHSNSCQHSSISTVLANNVKLCLISCYTILVPHEDNYAAVIWCPLIFYSGESSFVLFVNSNSLSNHCLIICRSTWGLTQLSSLLRMRQRKLFCNSVTPLKRLLLKLKRETKISMSRTSTFCLKGSPIALPSSLWTSIKIDLE